MPYNERYPIEDEQDDSLFSYENMLEPAVNAYKNLYYHQKLASKAIARGLTFGLTGGLTDTAKEEEMLQKVGPSWQNEAYTSVVDSIYEFGGSMIGISGIAKLTGMVMAAAGASGLFGVGTYLAAQGLNVTRWGKALTSMFAKPAITSLVKSGTKYGITGAIVDGISSYSEDRDYNPLASFASWAAFSSGLTLTGKGIAKGAKKLSATKMGKSVKDLATRLFGRSGKNIKIPEHAQKDVQIIADATQTDPHAVYISHLIKAQQGPNKSAMIVMEKASDSLKRDATAHAKSTKYIKRLSDIGFGAKGKKESFTKIKNRVLVTTKFSPTADNPNPTEQVMTVGEYLKRIEKFKETPSYVVLTGRTKDGSVLIPEHIAKIAQHKRIKDIIDLNYLSERLPNSANDIIPPKLGQQRLNNLQDDFANDFKRGLYKFKALMFRKLGYQNKTTEDLLRGFESLEKLRKMNIEEFMIERFSQYSPQELQIIHEFAKNPLKKAVNVVGKGNSMVKVKGLPAHLTQPYAEYVSINNFFNKWNTKVGTFKNVKKFMTSKNEMLRTLQMQEHELGREILQETKNQPQVKTLVDTLINHPSQISKSKMVKAQLSDSTIDRFIKWRDELLNIKRRVRKVRLIPFDSGNYTISRRSERLLKNAQYTDDMIDDIKVRLMKAKTQEEAFNIANSVRVGKKGRIPLEIEVNPILNMARRLDAVQSDLLWSDMVHTLKGQAVLFDPKKNLADFGRLVLKVPKNSNYNMPGYVLGQSSFMRRFTGLFQDEENFKYFISKPLANVLKDIRYTPDSGKVWQAYDKINMIGKTLRFHQPLIQPMFDIWQGWGPALSHKAAKGHKLIGNVMSRPLAIKFATPYIGDAWKHLSMKDAYYKEALSAGLIGSTPNLNLPIEKSLKITMDSFKKNSPKLFKLLEKSSGMTFAEFMKNHKKEFLSPTGPLFRAIGNASWSLDAVLKMSVAESLERAKGIPRAEAMRIAKTFMGDFNVLSKTAKKQLSRVFLTPSYKTSVMNAWYKMLFPGAPDMNKKGIANFLSRFQGEQGPLYYRGELLGMAWQTVLWAGVMGTLGYLPEGAYKWVKELEKPYYDKKGNYITQRVINSPSSFVDPAKLVERVAMHTKNRNLGYGIMMGTYYWASSIPHIGMSIYRNRDRLGNKIREEVEPPQKQALDMLFYVALDYYNPAFTIAQLKNDQVWYERLLGTIGVTAYGRPEYDKIRMLKSEKRKVWSYMLRKRREAQVSSNEKAEQIEEDIQAAWDRWRKRLYKAQQEVGTKFKEQLKFKELSPLEKALHGIKKSLVP